MGLGAPKVPVGRWGCCLDPLEFLTPLHSQIHKLQAENLHIRQPPGPVPTPPLPSERAEHASIGPGGSAHRRDRQAFSMYEPGSALKPFGGPPGDELATRLQPFHSTVSC